MDQGFLAVKLYEMEQRYGQMISRIQLCQGREHEKIRREIAEMEEECAASALLLDKRIAGSRTAAVAELAGAQRDYLGRVKEILEGLPDSLSGTVSASCKEGHEGEAAEAAVLYAEYAADFATLAADYALLAALKAADMQLVCEEHHTEGEK